jgi:hypothetical protein
MAWKMDICTANQLKLHFVRLRCGFGQNHDVVRLREDGKQPKLEQYMGAWVVMGQCRGLNMATDGRNQH